MNTAHIRLNLNKGTQPAGDEITIAQGDKHGLTITATIYDGAEKATLTGYTAHIVAQLPDRTHYYRETATINGSDVTAVIDETKIGTIPGHTDNAYFTLEATDGTIYSTARFGIDILNDALSDTTVAETYDNELEQLVKDAQSAIDKANEAYATLDVSAIKTEADAAKAAADTASVTATEAKNTAEAATTTADGKADKTHTHAIADVTGLQAALDAASSSGGSSGGGAGFKSNFDLIYPVGSVIPYAGDYNKFWSTVAVAQWARWDCLGTITTSNGATVYLYQRIE